MKKIGILGGLNHSWVSVDRTRRYLIRALEKTATLFFLDDPSCTIENDALDLVINFCGPEGWKKDHYHCPRLFFIHGGAILDEAFLRASLPNISTRDGIAVSCSSDVAVIRSFCKTPFENIFLLPLPVDQDTFFSVDKKLAKEMLGIEKDTLTIGLVARLLPQKNPHVFLRLIDILQNKIQQEIKPVIIGNFWIDYPVLDYRTNTYPAYFKELILKLQLEDKVSLLPADMPNEELNFMYNAMDLVIHPTNSIDENFGYVPVEAMACGTPVIGAAYGGLKDTLNNDICVQIPTYTTTNGIRMDIMGAMPQILKLTDTVIKGDVRAACVDWVSQHYSFDIFEKETYRIIDQLIAEFTEASAQNIETTAAISEENYPGDQLPETSAGIGWGHYAHNIRKYVSLQEVLFSENDFVYLDCPYLQSGDHTMERDDPAWPAQYHPDEMEMELFSFLERRERLTYEECIAGGFAIERVQKLIETGLLVISKSKKWKHP